MMHPAALRAMISDGRRSAKDILTAKVNEMDQQAHQIRFYVAQDPLKVSLPKFICL